MGAFDLKSEVMVIPRNVEFIGMTPDGKPGLKWKSRYGVVGINAIGLPLLIDGMNEKGLTVSVLYLPGFSKFEMYDPESAGITNGSVEVTGWILTNLASTDEVRKELPKVVVVDVPLKEFANMSPPIHFIITDAQGKTLVVEYAKGQLNMYDNPIGVLTNSPEFPWHLTNLRNYVGLQASSVNSIKVGEFEIAPLGVGNGMLGLPGDYSPPSRFVRAAALRNTVRPLESGYEAVTESFRIPDNFNILLGATSAQADIPKDGIVGSTQWTTAMDKKSLRYFYHTMFNRTIRMVDLKTVDFNKGKIRYSPLDLDKNQTIEILNIR